MATASPPLAASCSGDGMTRAAAAARVAAEVHRAADLDEDRISKVTSFLHIFGLPTSSGPGAQQVTEHLRELGVQVEPRLNADLPRDSYVSLRRLQDWERRPTEAVQEPRVSFSVWGPGYVEEERQLSAGFERMADSVLWFNVEPFEPARVQGKNHARTHGKKLAPVSPQRHDGDQRSALRLATSERRSSDPGLAGRAESLFQLLGRYCGGLELEMLKDLLESDPHPRIEAYSETPAGIRMVSSVAVIARELPADDSTDLDNVDKQLIFQQVEGIVGDGWIVTCWHPTQLQQGPGLMRRGDPLLREAFLGFIRNRWVYSDSRMSTAADVAMLLLRALANTYGASVRMLERWLDDWELQLFCSMRNAAGGDHKSANGKTSPYREVQHASREISNISGMVTEFRRRLIAFYSAREAMPGNVWFQYMDDSGSVRPNEQSERLEGFFRAAIQGLDTLSEAIRDNMNLLTLHSLSLQQAAGKKLEDKVLWVTVLVLVPTLIAGVFGANTRLPGGGEWLGFQIMILAMVAAGLAVYVFVRRS